MESGSPAIQNSRNDTLLPEPAKLQQFFTKRIVSADLLYRASDHGFSVLEFHRKCDGVEETVVLIQT